ncbi:hypothetical protein AAHA92_33879 [Salvia divinorum]|uniref:Uncharacterized protein n=1 Tax=Salvia divinorum TaxID=28513 RepID=A0ABD1FI51_SALDI
MNASMETSQEEEQQGRRSFLGTISLVVARSGHAIAVATESLPHCTRQPPPLLALAPYFSLSLPLSFSRSRRLSPRNGLHRRLSRRTPPAALLPREPRRCTVCCCPLLERAPRAAAVPAMVEFEQHHVQRTPFLRLKSNRRTEIKGRRVGVADCRRVFSMSCGSN